MSKNKSYAEQGLEEISEDSKTVEAALSAASTETFTSTSEDEFVQVGGLEPVKFYYRTSAPKKPTKSPFKILEKGQTINGTYVKSFNSGKFKNSTYLVKMDNGDLVGLPGAGSLTKSMSKLAEGSKVKITYNGVETIKGGEWAGNDAHSFIVFGNKLKQ